VQGFPFIVLGIKKGKKKKKGKKGGKGGRFVST
jgi:hypothetical protein